jgi:hypothetical protein
MVEIMLRFRAEWKRQLLDECCEMLTKTSSEQKSQILSALQNYSLIHFQLSDYHPVDFYLSMLIL